MNSNHSNCDNNSLETDLLLEGIYRKYGYDFRNYSRASLQRRIKNQIEKLQLNNPCELLHLVINQEDQFAKLLSSMTINVTEMFRDPGFYRSFREKVVPELRSYPSLKIWHAGCSTGEEVYSMSILLKEADLYDKSQIYATDINQKVLSDAKKGIFPIESISQFSENYLASGGQRSLSDYYVSKYNRVIMDNSLKENIVFANHDLVTDQVFGEMQVIICRNVLIYFNQKLQNRVFSLFNDSLDRGGTLCLGTQESLRLYSNKQDFEKVDEKNKIYKKTPHLKALPLQ